MEKMHSRVVGKYTLVYFCIKINNCGSQHTGYGGSGVAFGSLDIILASSHNRL